MSCGGFILLHTVFQTRALGMLMLLNLAHHIELEHHSGQQRGQQRSAHHMGFSRMRQNQDTNTQPTVNRMQYEKAASRDLPITCNTPSASVSVDMYCKA